MQEAHPIVEVREGGEVRAALVLDRPGSRLHLLLADGRSLHVPRARILHETGERIGGRDARALAESLKSWELGADERAKGIDVASLHELLLEEGHPLPLADLATLALGRDDGLARASVHRALARGSAWFRFTGERFEPRPREEVEEELAKRRRADELVRERERFIAGARARLGGSRDPLPDGSQKFLRALRDVALHGDQSKLKREAAAVTGEIEGREVAAPSADHAFELLVALGDMSADENLALLRAGVRADFAPEVVAEAEAAARRRIDAASRRDFRSLEVVTIDDASTTEVDDGVSFEVTPRGVRVGIHIADTAHFVDRGSLLDQDAQDRATSYYLPERMIKMLPPVLAEGASSLVEGELRPTLSFLVDMTPHGEITGFECAESVVRVARRMTHDDCEAALRGEGGPAWLPRLQGLVTAFEQQRSAAGATPIRAAEVAIRFDADGDPVIELIDPGRPARTLVAELMVMANHLVARWCRDRGLPAIYRKQARPSGAAPPPPRDRIDPVAAFDFRKTLQRTEVSLEPGPHAGLGVDCYVQATSPIRRYQDLALHRIVKAALRGEPMPYSREELQAVAFATEQAGRQARQIENETDRYWTLRALEKRVGRELEAIVLRAEDRHTLVELVEYAYVTPLAARPDHVKGQRLRLRIKASRPRKGTVLLEQVG